MPKAKHKINFAIKAITGMESDAIKVIGRDTSSCRRSIKLNKSDGKWQPETLVKKSMQLEKPLQTC